MRQPITIAAVFIIVFTLTITGQPLNTTTKANLKRAELLEESEVAKALARLGDLSRPALREKLKQMRQLDYRPSPLLVSKIIAAQHLPLAEGQGVDRLKAALQPVLDYHGRNQMPIYVLRSAQPKAYVAERTVIFITTRLMMQASDEEMRGIVAHEVAHEYVWEDCAKAMKEKDWKLRRECELFCDAIAAFTLKEIGDDPASYGRILVRLAIIGIRAGNAAQHESDTHPSLDVRKKLNQFLCERFD